MLNDTQFFQNLSIRRKQAFAALCLARFCAVKNIHNPAIDELVKHLLSILVCPSLVQWEDQGAKLALTGRGDPVPESIQTRLPDEVKKDDFQRLVDYTVEVGLVDMYGALTQQPLHYLLECISILKAHGVTPPSVKGVFEIPEHLPQSKPAWGDPSTTQEYERVLSLYRSIHP